MDPANTILVVGATGALGRPTVALLRARGVQVRALNRHPAQASDLAALGAEVVAGDLTDPASLQRACMGVSRVMACAHGLLGRGRYRSEAVDDAGHRALIAAACDAGVRRFVYTSALGAAVDSPVDFMRRKFTIELALQRSGLDTVVLRPSAFMEWHAHKLNGQGLLDKGRARLIGPGTKLRNFVAASDVAALAVRALLEDPPTFRLLEIGGHDNLNNLDVTALYAKFAGQPASASHLPMALARAMALLAAPLHPGIARILRLATLSDTQFPEVWTGAAELERQFGLRLTRLEDFVRARVAEARGQAA